MNDVDAETASNASFFSTSTTTTRRPRQGLVPVEDTAAESALQTRISSLLARTTQSVLQRQPSSVAAPLAREAEVFMRMNGMPIDDRAERRHETTTPTSPKAESHTQELMRDVQQLIRQLDGERRSYRQRAMQLQREVGQRLADRAAARRRAAESHHRNLQLETLLASAHQRVRAANERDERRTEELMRLRRLVRALPPSTLAVASTQDGNVAPSPNGVTTTLVPDRRFEEAFRDKMDVIAYKRRYRAMKSLYLRTHERYEALCLSLEDMDASLKTQQTTPVYVDDTVVRSDVHVARDTASRHEAAAWRLVFSPAVTEDGAVRAWLSRSDYGAPLRRARDEVLRLGSRLADSHNRGVEELYGVFLDLLQRPCRGGVAPERDRRVFEAHMSRAQRRLHTLLTELAQRVNSVVAEVAALETAKTPSRTATAAAPSYTRDVGCSAVYVSDAEFRVHRLERQLEQQQHAAWTATRELQQRLDAALAENGVVREGARAALEHLHTLRNAVHAATDGGQVAEDDAALDEAIGSSDAVLTDPRLAIKLSEATERTARRLTSVAGSVPSTATAHAVIARPRRLRPRGRRRNAAAVVRSVSRTRPPVAPAALPITTISIPAHSRAPRVVESVPHVARPPHELAPIPNKASRLRAATALARRNTMPTLASSLSYVEDVSEVSPSSPTQFAHSTNV